MSLESIIGLQQTGIDKLQELQDHAQSVAQKRQELAVSQEELRLNKQLNEAKIKDAKVSGMLSDVVADSLQKTVGEKYKAKEGVLKAHSALIDNTALKLEKDINDHKQFVDHLQGAANTIGAIQQSRMPSAMATVNPITTMTPKAPASPLAGGVGPDGQKIPSIFPMTSQQPSPVETTQPTPAVAPVTPTSAPAEAVAAPTEPEATSAAVSAESASETPQTANAQGGVFDEIQKDIKSKMGQAYWLNPATHAIELDPVMKAQMESRLRAQEQYAINKIPERFNKLDRNLDPSAFRSGAFGDSKKVFDRGERLRTLVDATFEQPGGADSRQIAELAIGLQNMLSGGTGSTTEVMSLLPKSAVGNANKISEWISNNPTGAGQQKFVNRLRDTIYREMDITQAQMDRTRIQRLANFSDLKKIDEEKYNNTLESYGITPDKIDAYQKGGIKALTELARQAREGVTGNTSDEEQKDYSHLWQ